MKSESCAEEFTDIHCHILPGADDGAEDIAMSLRMLRQAVENGIGRIILTPHCKPAHRNISPQRMKEDTERLKERAAKEGLYPELYMGNELYYHSGLPEELEKAGACTLAGSSYVLVEFAPPDPFAYIRGGLYQLLAAGFQPVLAHAERYQNISSSVERAEELVRMGCYLQVNADSVMGKTGYPAKHFTRQLLKLELVHFVATDAHNDGKRGPVLLECAGYLRRKYGEDRMRRLLTENPAAVIADRSL